VHIPETRFSSWAPMALVIVVLTTGSASAQSLPSVDFSPQAQTQSQGQAQTPPQLPQGITQEQAEKLKQNMVTCTSNVGERISCPANTTAGVVLVRSTGASACLLGKTWGYDDKSIWVSDGCSGQFFAGELPGLQTRQRPLEHVPNVGFLLYTGDEGEIYFRLFTYARYLNQKNIDPSYVDFFGNTHTVAQREDMQLQKFFAPFSGWFLTPKMRYYLYVWSSNASQGDPAQVVGAGNISYSFNRFVTFGAGITSLPSTRSTEGQFPYWLGVDDRLIADEFFRGSYTTGFWFKGEIATTLKYHVMFANNLSTLGVSAAQMDNTFDTQSYSLQWLPTTGEFGLWGTFGDYDDHQKMAVRVAGHFTRSTEDRQSQPGTEGIENSQIRLTDGSQIFTPDLFGPGIRVNKVLYKMTSIDAGIKYKGMSVEAEYYTRWLNNFQGVNVGGLEPITDTGYQVQSSAMLVKKYLQGYVSGSQIFGDYGDSSDFRIGMNWYFRGERGLRVNGEWIKVNKSPVGYTAYPMPVGANGHVFHFNLEMNF
jgi:hypothetical protein